MSFTLDGSRRQNQSFRLNHAGGGGGDEAADYIFGASSLIANAGNPSFLYPGVTNSATVAAVSSAGQDTIQFTGLLQDFRIRQIPAGGAVAITYRIQINGIDVYSIATTSNTALVSDLVTTVAVTEGDAVAVTAQHGGASGSGARPVFRFRNVRSP